MACIVFVSVFSSFFLFSFQPLLSHSFQYPYWLSPSFVPLVAQTIIRDRQVQHHQRLHSYLCVPKYAIWFLFFSFGNQPIFPAHQQTSTWIPFQDFKCHNDVGVLVQLHMMPCLRLIRHQPHCFLPHFPPGSMQCHFSSELVPLLHHAMREVFPKVENECTVAPSSSPPLSPLTLTGSTHQLIPKPPGEVGRNSRGGYLLKDVLQQQHGWEDDLYHKIRV